MFSRARRKGDPRPSSPATNRHQTSRPARCAGAGAGARRRQMRGSPVFTPLSTTALPFLLPTGDRDNAPGGDSLASQSHQPLQRAWHCRRPGQPPHECDIPSRTCALGTDGHPRPWSAAPTRGARRLRTSAQARAGGPGVNAPGPALAPRPPARRPPRPPCRPSPKTLRPSVVGLGPPPVRPRARTPSPAGPAPRPFSLPPPRPQSLAFNPARLRVPASSAPRPCGARPSVGPRAGPPSRLLSPFGHPSVPALRGPARRLGRPGLPRQALRHPAASGAAPRPPRPPPTPGPLGPSPPSRPLSPLRPPSAPGPAPRPRGPSGPGRGTHRRCDAA